MSLAIPKDDIINYENIEAFFNILTPVNESSISIKSFIQAIKEK